ncbi:MAG: hypothetical protein QM813_15510 [Verrucomicrobiota bacterium]
MNSVPDDLTRPEVRSANEPLSPDSASRRVVTILADSGVATSQLQPLARQSLAEAVRVLHPGGLLFIYGAPAELPHWGEYLLTTPEVAAQTVFKYWIAIDLNDKAREGFLQPTHQGLLLFMKRDSARKTSPPFRLHVNDVRVPHRDCPACGENVKDWGGKKHLINPLGAAPSDVWRDLPRRSLPRE